MALPATGLERVTSEMQQACVRIFSLQRARALETVQQFAVASYVIRIVFCNFTPHTVTHRSGKDTYKYMKIPQHCKTCISFNYIVKERFFE